MKKYSFLIICTLLTGLLFTTCEPWIVPEAVFVNFNANGGQGDMKALRFMDGEKQALTKNTYTRNGYIFDGWNTMSDGRGQSYTDRQNVTITKSVTLYAQWRQKQVISGTENGHDYVDLGLPSGLKWATCNVGATAPEGYGDYFAWGETSPKDNYDWSTYKYCNGSAETLTKYNISSYYGTVDNKNILELTDDAARVNWGGKWRMPTKAEHDELIKNCTWTWTTQDGVNGYKVTSKTNGNSIFLPAASWRYGTSVYDVGSSGYYWSSSLYESNPNYAYYLYFSSGDVNWNFCIRYCGLTVRAVCGNNTAAQTFTLTFNANGGTGTMPAQTFEAGVSQAITANTFTRSGYTFTGWNTNADGSGTAYTDKQSITLSQDMTLYAQWEVIATTGIENGHEWVDLGLPSGLKWATCNVGATTPEGYGDYFAWGETSPKNDYSWSTYKYCNGSETSLTKYNTSSDFGTVDDKTLLEFSDDAARANWGGKWRMPTNSEVIELNDNCSWTWTTQNGVSGYKVTSKTNGNSIFLPAAGYRYDTSVYNVGTFGDYWSSSLSESDPYYAFLLYFSSGYVDWSFSFRRGGRTVRAVFSENDTPSTFVTLSFDANGGSGMMPAQTFEAGVSQAITANTFTRSGYTFTGWNTNADGSGTSYTDGQEITLTQDMTLYAQWESAGGSGGGSSISGTENDHDYVDLGLPSGLKWATCNVGATTPDGYGDYFAWGETEPKSNYDWSTYKYCNGSSYGIMTKYCTHSSYGTVDNKTILELTDDAARANWGGKWRMPTIAEQNELRNNCTWTWTTQNGIKGYKVTSKTNGNSIFLPAAGYRDGTSVYGVGSGGYYWSSSLYESNPYYAYYMSFYSGGVGWPDYDRFSGLTVRAVFSDNDKPSTFVTLTFNANGGSGTMAAQTFEAGVSQAIAANAFTRSGYTFTGWNTKADGSGTSYTDKQSITISQNITLYAQWEQEQVVSGTENGHDYVVLGLPSGLKWATCNVGATTPEAYGDYFAWGETSPKDNYVWSTYKYCNGSYDTMTKYCTNSNYGYNRFTDNKTILELSDDAARVTWGGNWRMPTYAELDELSNNCTWTRTTQNGVSGYKVTSKTNGNSIFLPAAGHRGGTSVYSEGTYGYYWSSSLYEGIPNYACNLYINSGRVDWSSSDRYYGLTVRAVCP